MTITVNEDEKTIDQVVKQVAKQIDVLKVEELRGGFVMRELSLIKVKVNDAKERSDIINFVEVFRGRIIDVSTRQLNNRDHRHTRKNQRFPKPHENLWNT